MEMKLPPRFFSKVKGGTKTVEMRLYDEERQKIRLRDEIKFVDIESGESVSVFVTQLLALSSCTAQKIQAKKIHADCLLAPEYSLQKVLGFSEGTEKEPNKPIFDFLQETWGDKVEKYGLLFIVFELAGEVGKDENEASISF